MKPKITTLVPWFGSNRTLAENVGEALDGCRWVGVPFAGGMSELLHIRANTVVVGDLHKHLMNLANVLAHPHLGPKLIRRLRRRLFHEGELERSQRFCSTFDPLAKQTPTEDDFLDWAEHYFVASWMSRNATAGTKDEFKSGLSVRWTATGGDSAVRFRSAVASLRGWRRVVSRCTFIVKDAFEFLAETKDRLSHGHGIYCDPPFPVAGRSYKHNAGNTEAEERDWQIRLRDAVERFEYARVVMRFYDHPLIRELYSESKWDWHRYEGRTQANGIGPEVLLVNKTGDAPCEP